jgi:hypothetical protein
METSSRRLLLPFLAPPLVPPACSVLAPDPVQTAETPFFLLATAPVEGLSPLVTWLDDLEHRLSTDFTRRRRWLTDRNESCRRGIRHFLSSNGTSAATEGGGT